MKRWFIGILGFVFYSSTISICYAQTICEGKQITPISSFNQCNHNEWIIVFEDNFNGYSLNASTWQLRPWGEGALYGNGGSSQEYNTLDNVEVGDGVLKIVTRRDTIVRRAIHYKPDSEILSDGLANLRPYYFTSSNIWSVKQFEFGKLEARIRIPKGKGFWPAFWMYGGNVCWNELDVFEFWNEKTLGHYNSSLLSKILHMTAHYDYDHDGETNLCGTSHPGSDFSTNFHVYAIEWEPNKIAWYLDGNCLREDYRYYTIQGQTVGCDVSANTYYMINLIYPINPMNIIFNLAIQHNNDNDPDGSTVFPAYLEIDWVRYYKRGSSENVSISDSSLMPLSNSNYNSIIGAAISFNCSYTINQGNQLYAVANREIVLHPGFYAEEGCAFSAQINENTCLTSTDTLEPPKKLMSSSVVAEESLSLPRIFPTVTHGEINVEIPYQYIERQLYIKIVDINGRVKFSQYLQGSERYCINLVNCSNGMYMIQLLDNSHTIIKTEKIIISK